MRSMNEFTSISNRRTRCALGYLDCGYRAISTLMTSDRDNRTLNTAIDELFDRTITPRVSAFFFSVRHSKPDQYGERYFRENERRLCALIGD